MKLATDGDETKLFESEFQWLITRLAKKLPYTTSGQEPERVCSLNPGERMGLSFEVEPTMHVLYRLPKSYLFRSITSVYFRISAVDDRCQHSRPESTALTVVGKQISSQSIRRLWYTVGKPAERNTSLSISQQQCLSNRQTARALGEMRG